MKTNDQRTRLIGTVSVMLSALTFGVTPSIAALSYQGGNNGINMAFLRALLPIPVLFLLSRKYQRPSRRQILRGLLLGVLLYSFTLLSYSSFSYIPVGTSTTLQFLYALYVPLYAAVFKKQPLSKRKYAGLAVGLGGVMLFLDARGGALSPFGVTLAVLSGVCYAAYILVLDREKDNPLPLFQLTLIICVAGATLCGGMGLVTGSLTVGLTPKAWVFAASAALLTVIVGCVLFQKGVRMIGDSEASLLSLLEPLTSVLCGVWLVGDPLNVYRVAGCVFILVSLFLVAADKSN